MSATHMCTNTNHTNPGDEEHDDHDGNDSDTTDTDSGCSLTLPAWRGSLSLSWEAGRSFKPHIFDLYMCRKVNLETVPAIASLLVDFQNLFCIQNY